MEAKEILVKLKKWRYDWEVYLPLNSADTYGRGAQLVKDFTLKRLATLIQEIEHGS